MMHRFARIGWLALIVVLAVVAVGTELDRESRRGTIPAGLVPGAFQAFALAQVTTNAVKSGNPEQALGEARALVARRPLPAENLMLLGLAELKAGHVREGNIIVQLAARRGWRDRGAQEAMLRISLEAGDLNEAASRLAALWIQPDASPELVPITAGFIASEPARAALAQRLASGGYWVSDFLRQAPAFDPDGYSQVLAMANEAGARLDCRLIEHIVQGYVDAGKTQAAERAWTGSCPAGRPLPQPQR